MSDVDWAPLLQAVGSLAGTVITIIVAVYLPRAVKAFEQMSGVQLDASQQASVYAAADTAKKLIVSMVEQGKVPLAQATDPNHPVVAGQALHALQRVPESAAAQNVSTLAMSQIIASKVADAKPKLQLQPDVPTAASDDKPLETRSVPVFGGRPSGGPGIVAAPLMTVDQIRADLADRTIATLPGGVTPPWKGTEQ